MTGIESTATAVSALASASAANISTAMMSAPVRASHDVLSDAPKSPASQCVNGVHPAIAMAVQTIAAIKSGRTASPMIRALAMIGSARRSAARMATNSNRRGLELEAVGKLGHDAGQRAIDQRLRLDEPRAVRAELLGKLLGGHRQRLLPLAIGEEVGAAQRADPCELGERKLRVGVLEFDPHAAIHAARDFQELVLDDGR